MSRRGADVERSPVDNRAHTHEESFPAPPVCFNATVVLEPAS